MHDELKERCRACSQGCIYPSECSYFDKPPLRCMRQLLSEAADAIEELSAKATPKRVGFSGWKGCRDTRYKCPLCTKYVRNDEKYCHKCGQALMFPIIRHTPYVPGKRQEVIISWPDEPPEEETRS